MQTASRGRARIGVVVPVSNTNLEPDMQLMRPDGASMHFARAGGYDLDEVPDAAQMKKLALNSLGSVMTDLAAARPDVVLYGCTSATLAHGPEFDREFCGKISAITGAPAITAAGSLVQALTAMDIRKIAFSSPYVAALNDDAIGFLGACGFETVSRMDVNEDLGNYGQGELTPDEVFDLGTGADSADAEALVLSCTDMRAVETITRLEAELGKPVITSNQAMIFAASLQLGLEPAHVPEYGQLLSAGNMETARAAALRAA
ncbi:MAG: Asp/Glu racemase [Pseudomonadota bacterium]